MNSIKQKKRLHSQTVEDSTAIATTKTQSKKLKQNNENVTVKSVENKAKKQKVGAEASVADQPTASQRKRVKTKERKLAAIAKIKEAGGVPKPLHPSKSGKSKLDKTNARDFKTTDAVPKTPTTLSTSGEARQVEEKLKKVQEKRLEKKILRKEKRQQEGQYKLENITLSIDEIKERMNAIQSRGNLTKTAKRKLGILRKKLAIADGTYVPKPPVEKSDNDKLSKSQKRRLKRKNENSATKNDVESKEGKPNVEKPVDIHAFEKKVKKNQPQEEQMKPVKKSAQVKSTNKLNPKSQEQNKGAVTQAKLNGQKKEVKDKGAAKNKKIVKGSKEDSDDEEEEDEEDSESEDGDENETTVLNSKAKKLKVSSTHDNESNDEDDDDEEEDDEEAAEEEAGSDEDDEEQEDVDDEEKEDEDDEEDEDEDDEEEENEDDAADDSDVENEVGTEEKGDVKSQKKTNKGLTENGNTVKKQQLQNQDQEKKKRYVLFVGNIPFDAKSEDLKNHFLTKVSQVISVRIPTKTGTQVPRGFAYVEVTNDIDYEKGLSLHHSFINGRRINVEYTLSGSKQVGQRKDLISKNKKLDALRKAGKLAGGQKHDQKRSVRRFKQRNQDRIPF